jgi:hypothetical protein
MISLRGRRRMLFAGSGGALALMAAVAIPGSASATPGSASATPAAATVKLGAGPLGMNIAPWDSLYTGSSGAIVQALMKKAGIDGIRYGGGTTADYFNWKTDTSIGNCLPNSAPAEYKAKCAVQDALYYTLFSKNARAIGAQSFVTVNYGSGTPALAAAWVKQAKTKPGQQVGLWEVGNENYGCWEVNNELASAPADFKGYKEGVNGACPMNVLGLDPGMTAMSKSYAVNAAKFLAAMRAASPSAQLGVPWAFGGDVGGASVGDNTQWNDTVIPAAKKYISFVDVHWYPYNFGGNLGGSHPTAEQVLRSLFQIAPVYAETRAQLNALDPGARIAVGETGVTYLATTIPCTPVGALFAAGDALSWLAAGAETVDWWQLNSYGNIGSKCTKPDEGMFTSAGKPVPETPYIGYLLASALTKPGAQLRTLPTSNTGNVLAYQSVLNGKVAVALINTNTTSAIHLAFGSSLHGNLKTLSYKAAGQNSSNTRVTAGVTTAAAVAKKGIVLPAESMLVLTMS